MLEVVFNQHRHRLNVTSYLISHICSPEAGLLYGANNPYRANKWGEFFWIKMSGVFEKKIELFVAFWVYLAMWQYFRFTVSLNKNLLQSEKALQTVDMEFNTRNAFAPRKGNIVRRKREMRGRNGILWIYFIR